MKDFRHFTDKMLKNLKIQALNEMQFASIEAHEQEGDILLLSPTGSGKTLAFLLPLIWRLQPNINKIQALIIAPSRELALQIESVLKNLASGHKITCCYGGHPVRIEKQSLLHPPAILVGTPGRIKDHLRRGNILLNDCKMLVLDEFDKSLEMGFHKDMEFIIDHLKNLDRKTLTSATDALEIPEFVRIDNLNRIDFLDNSKKPDKLKLKQVISPERDKLETLFNLICNLGNEPMIVFGNHRESVQRTSDYLKEKGIPQICFHGKLEQIDREKMLMQFRNGSFNIMVATDLAARGLDIPEIKYIIHYHMPTTEQAFIHRNGRTARMNARGTAYMIVHEEEQLPDYIRTPPGIQALKPPFHAPKKPDWITLYIGKGKKDKIGKIDIVGFILKQGNLEKSDMGLIEIKDFFSYVAISRSKINKLVGKLNNEKIKGKKVKVEVLRTKLSTPNKPPKKYSRRF